jgi:TrmH family RNA methyltransferase
LINRSFIGPLEWYHSAILFDAVSARAPRPVTSRHNPNIARYRAVARGEVPELLLLDGPHLVAEAARAGIALESAAVLSTALDRPEIRTLLASIDQPGVDVVATTPQVMAVVSPVKSSSAIVALGRRPVATLDRMYAGPAPLVIIADDVQDPGNMGAIIRAAEAGGATGVAAAGACADPFGWKALRGSSGSALRLPIVATVSAASAIAEARKHGCRVIATVARGGRSLYDVDLRGPAAVMIGGEGPGLDPSMVRQADEQLTIPMQPQVESLNAAVAAALVVYEARRQRR